MAGSIKKKDNGKYAVRLFVGYDAEGKRKYWNKTFDRKKDAELALAAKIKERGEYGVVFEPENIILTKYLYDWLEASVKNKVRPVSYNHYKYYIKKYIAPKLGGYKIKTISPEMIQKYYFDLQQENISPSTIRNIHHFIRSAFKQAIRWRKLKINPFEYVDVPKQGKREMRFLTEVEAKAFLDIIKGTRYGCFFELLLLTGMRPGEAAGLKWEDIDFKNKYLTINRTLSRPQNDKVYILTNPKTKMSQRTIPLPNEMLESLKKHKINQAEKKMEVITRESRMQQKLAQEGIFYQPKNYQENSFVFADPLGEPINVNQVLRTNFKNMVKLIGVPELRIYDLRHTCASLLLQAGENPKVVAELLGHSTIKTTLETYSHLQPGMKETASEKLRKMLY